MQYSKQLVLEIQKIFKEEYSKEISDEAANEYLESFASLFLAIAKIREGRETWA